MIVKRKCVMSITGDEIGRLHRSKTFTPLTMASSQASSSYHSMSMPSIVGTQRIDTVDCNFLLPSSDNTRTILLRGVNLASSAKYPNYSASRRPKSPSGKDRKSREAKRKLQAGINSSMGEEWGFWSEAEKGGRRVGLLTSRWKRAKQM